jgi:hypothetical protein
MPPPIPLATYRLQLTADFGFEKAAGITFHPADVLRFSGSTGKVWRQAVADLRRAWEDAALLESTGGNHERLGTTKP